MLNELWFFLQMLHTFKNMEAGCSVLVSISIYPNSLVFCFMNFLVLKGSVLLNIHALAVTSIYSIYTVLKLLWVLWKPQKDAQEIIATVISHPVTLKFWGYFCKGFPVKHVAFFTVLFSPVLLRCSAGCLVPGSPLGMPNSAWQHPGPQTEFFLSPFFISHGLLWEQWSTYDNSFQHQIIIVKSTNLKKASRGWLVLFLLLFVCCFSFVH